MAANPGGNPPTLGHARVDPLTFIMGQLFPEFGRNNIPGFTGGSMGPGAKPGNASLDPSPFSTEPSQFRGATFGRAGELGHTFTGFADTLIEGGDEALTGALEDILTGIFGEIDTLEGTKTSPEQLNARLGELGNQIAAGRTALTQQSSREAQRRGVFSQGLADEGAAQASARARSSLISGETQIRDTVADHNAQIDTLIASLRGDVGEAIGGAKAQSLALNVAGREAQTLNDNLQLFGQAQANAQLFQSFVQPFIPPLLQFLFRGGR